MLMMERSPRVNLGTERAPQYLFDVASVESIETTCGAESVVQLKSGGSMALHITADEACRRIDEAIEEASERFVRESVARQMSSANEVLGGLDPFARYEGMAIEIREGSGETRTITLKRPSVKIVPTGDAEPEDNANASDKGDVPATAGS